MLYPGRSGFRTATAHEWAINEVRYYALWFNEKEKLFWSSSSSEWRLDGVPQNDDERRILRVQRLWLTDREMMSIPTLRASRAWTGTSCCSGMQRRGGLPGAEDDPQGFASLLQQCG